MLAGGRGQSYGHEIRKRPSGRAGICHGPERGRAGTGLYRRVTFRRTSGFRVGGGKEPQSQRVKRQQLQAVPGFGQGARRRSRPSSGHFSWRQTRSGLGSVFSVLFSLPSPFPFLHPFLVYLTTISLTSLYASHHSGPITWPAKQSPRPHSSYRLVTETMLVSVNELG